MLNTIPEKLKAIKENPIIIPVVIAAFILLGTTGVDDHFAIPSHVAAAATAITDYDTTPSYDDAALTSMSGPQDEGALSQEDSNWGAIIIDDSAVVNTTNPERGVLTSRDGVLIYKVQKGDMLSTIAAKFGISLNTLYWANNNLKSSSLRIGQEIIVLPISGVFHTVQPNETLESIAALYDVQESRIAKYNAKILARGFEAGSNIIVPDAKPQKGVEIARQKLPDYPGYYALPTTGWNWGKLHHNNAVDIANACGTPIYASAEGLVITVSSPNGWNEGYGGQVIIEHPNSTKTRYAHTERNVVSVGNYVLQGDTIAYIGNSGLTHGPTGCHVHFEIIGARNLFAK